MNKQYQEVLFYFVKEKNFTNKYTQHNQDYVLLISWGSIKKVFMNVFITRYFSPFFWQPLILANFETKKGENYQQIEIKIINVLTNFHLTDIFLKPNFCIITCLFMQLFI